MSKFGYFLFQRLVTLQLQTEQWALFNFNCHFSNFAMTHVSLNVKRHELVTFSTVEIIADRSLATSSISLSDQIRIFDMWPML